MSAIALPFSSWPLRLLRFGLIGIGLAVALVEWSSIAFSTRQWDAYAYWSFDPASPYALPEGTAGAFAYSPVVAMLFTPFHALPWPAFHVLWTTMLVLALLWLSPPVLWAPAFMLLEHEIRTGNVHILIAAGVVLALSRAAWWAMPVLLKVTPAIGLLWHAARREWRSLGMALGVIGALVTASFLIAPWMWIEWIAFLSQSTSAGGFAGYALELALWPRLIIAAAIVVVAARRNVAWLVPLAVFLALPIIWWKGVPAAFLAAIRLGLQPRPVDAEVVVIGRAEGERALQPQDA